jgi:hypothetical protein
MDARSCSGDIVFEPTTELWYKDLFELVQPADYIM